MELIFLFAFFGVDIGPDLPRNVDPGDEIDLYHPSIHFVPGTLLVPPQ